VLRLGPDGEPPYSAVMLAQFASASPSALGMIDGVASLVRETVAQWPADRPLRILEVWAGGGVLTRRLAALAAGEMGTIGARGPERLVIVMGAHPGIRTEQFDVVANDASDLGRFDLVISAATLGRPLAEPPAVQRLPRWLAAGGAVVLAVPASNVFADVIF